MTTNDHSCAARTVGQGWVPVADNTFPTRMGESFTRTAGDYLEIGLQTCERHRNLSGTVHGGVLMTLLDRVMGLNARRAIGMRAPTATITVNFLRPASPGAFVVASCRMRRVGKGTVFADGEVYDGDKLIATACATFVKPAPF